MRGLSVTGNVVAFGSGFEMYNEDRPDKAQPLPITLPDAMGAVTILKVCKDLLLLDGNRTFRFTQRSEFDYAFSCLIQIPEEIIDIAAGAQHYLCLTESGIVYSFGRNDQGQLGIGHTRDTAQPTAVTKFIDLQEKVVQVAAGTAHSAAVTASGKVYVWGRGSEGQTGITPVVVAPCLVPRFVNKLQNEQIKAVDCGASFVSVLTAEGNIFFWGSGLTKKMQQCPLQVTCPERACFIDFSGGSTHIAAVSSDGKLFTMGLGVFGQLGNGPEACKTETMTAVDTNARIERVFCGAYYTAAIARDGTVFSCGSAVNYKLGHGDTQHQFVPRPIASLLDTPVTRVACGDDNMICLVPTQITKVFPQVADTAGGTHISLSGIGLYNTGAPVHVKFLFPNQEILVEGWYDEAKKCVVVESPEVDLEEALNDYTPNDTVSCTVSMSLNGDDYSNQSVLYLFVQPSHDNQSFLDPAFGPYCGGSQVTLTASFDNVPYDGVSVRLTPFTEEQDLAEPVVVPATYDQANSCLRFTTPKYGPEVSSSSDLQWPSLCQMKVDISLDGQQFYFAGNIFSYYAMETYSVNPNDIGLCGGAVEVLCSGIHFSNDITVKLSINGGDETLLTGRFNSSSMVADSEQELDDDMASLLVIDDEQDELFPLKADAQGEEDTSTFAATGVTRTISSMSKAGDKGGAETNSLSGTKTIESINRTQSGMSMNGEQDPEDSNEQPTEEDTVQAPVVETLDSLVSKGKKGVGYVWCQLPSFVYYGECQVVLSISLNGRDFVQLPDALKINISRPITESLFPDCGPKEGGTLIQLQGKHFYHTNNISLVLKNKDEVKGAKEKAPEPPLSATRQKTPAGKDKGALDDEDVVPPAPFEGGRVFTLPGEYRDRFGSPCVEFTAPGASNRGVVELVVGFDPKENAFTTNRLAFTYYESPVVTDIEPAVVPTETLTSVTVNGGAFHSTEYIKIRLVVKKEEEAKGGLSAKKPAPATGKKGKKTPTGAAEVVEEEEVKEEDTVMPSVVVSAKYVHVLPVDPDAAPGAPPKSAAKGKPPPKGKGAKGAPGEDPPFLTFTTPPLQTFVPPEMAEAGFTCDIELAMNGQQFVPTGQTLKFQPGAVAGETKGTKKKK